MSLRVPAGALSTHVRVALRGYASLPGGVTGVVTSGATFGAEAPLDSRDESLPGPTRDDYLLAREFDLATSEGAEAVRTLTIATRLGVPASADDALLTLDSLDVAVGTDDTVIPTLSVSRDTPLPAVSATPSVLPNVNGWNNTDVTVSFACTPPDAFTIVPALSSLGDVTLTAIGTAVGTCAVDDADAGTPPAIATAAYSARIDRDPPTITITVPAADGLYGLGATVPSAVACADASSGIATCSAPATVDTSAPGAHAFTAVATGEAGNTTETTTAYQVGGKDDCKHNGWRRFLVPRFRNQGQCVSTFVP